MRRNFIHVWHFQASSAAAERHVCMHYCPNSAGNCYLTVQRSGCMHTVAPGRGGLTDEQRCTCLLILLASSCKANTHKHLISAVWIKTNLELLSSSSKLSAQYWVTGGGMVARMFPCWFTDERTDSPRSLPEPWATSGWAQPVEVWLAEHIRPPRSSRERRRTWQTCSGILVQ